jgi:hypothetical protein
MLINLRDRPGSLGGNTLVESNPNVERIPTPPIVVNGNPFQNVKELLTKFAVTRLYQRYPSENSSHRQPCPNFIDILILLEMKRRKYVQNCLLKSNKTWLWH